MAPWGHPGDPGDLVFVRDKFPHKLTISLFSDLCVGVIGIRRWSGSITWLGWMTKIIKMIKRRCLSFVAKSDNKPPAEFASRVIIREPTSSGKQRTIITKVNESLVSAGGKKAFSFGIINYGIPDQALWQLDGRKEKGGNERERERETSVAQEWMVLRWNTKTAVAEKTVRRRGPKSTRTRHMPTC